MTKKRVYAKFEYFKDKMCVGYSDENINQVFKTPQKCVIVILGSKF